MKAATRLDRIDRLRAVAMLWMTAYHLCFDLDFFGFVQADMLTDPFWTVQRTAIVSLFLFTAGLSQAVAGEQGVGWPRFGRRWVQVAGAALLVTAGSALVFPRTFIYFGVLHAMAVMVIVARLSAGWGRWLWPLGGLALVLSWLAPAAMAAWPTLEFLNQPGWNALGFINRKPITEDYVPLLPWLGVVWWGLASGQWLLRHRRHWLGSPQGDGALAILGRWSLSYYLLHQPVMLGLLSAWVWWRG